MAKRGQNPGGGGGPAARVDARGEFCPRPIIMIASAVKGVRNGETVLLLADDPGVESDMEAWRRATGHEIIERRREGEVFTYLVRKREAAAGPAQEG